MHPREIELTTDHGTARISLLGATVLSWKPKGLEDVLWVSPGASFEPGKAIRGGIPVCWPWFAADARYPNGPSHGLVRAAEWTVLREEAGAATLEFRHDDEALFPAFRLELDVQLGSTLTVSLTHYNLADEDVSCNGALHTYLRANAASATVQGLGRALAYDKVQAKSITVADPVRFEGKTDLVLTSSGTAILNDGARRLAIHRIDAPDAVLWNPAKDRPGDIPVGGESEFVCVEAAAVGEPWTVPARGQRTLATRLEVLTPAAG